MTPTMIDVVARHVIPAALFLLPDKMDTLEARAMLLAIGLQESKFKARRQHGNGPARGFWQFEKNGAVRGVLSHKLTRVPLRMALHTLCYPDPATGEERAASIAFLHQAIEHNDVLACVFARLNLWWLPDTLPGEDESGDGWAQYLEAWQPGKPHPATWKAYYKQAWAVVHEMEGLEP